MFCLLDARTLVQDGWAENVSAVGLHFPFNPSLLFWNGDTLISFRATPRSSFGIRAYVTRHGDKSDFQIVDLSEHCLQFGVDVVADPKLFRFGDEIWATFNTGWRHDGNDIFLLRIAPELGAPIRCVYANRKKIEKNWAFYSYKGSLRALYSLDGGAVLEATVSNLNGVRELEMVAINHLTNEGDTSLSIGSQLCFVDDDAYLMAHKKIQLFGKRLYVGKAVKIRMLNTTPSVETSGTYVFHSWLSLVGSRVKRNKNLISCSYFSGMEFANGRFLLGYGVNDVSFGFAQVTMEELF